MYSVQSQIFPHMASLEKWAAAMCQEVSALLWQGSGFLGSRCQRDYTQEASAQSGGGLDFDGSAVAILCAVQSYAPSTSLLGAGAVPSAAAGPGNPNAPKYSIFTLKSYRKYFNVDTQVSSSCPRLSLTSHAVF